ncbi:MAG: hypothetical protein WCP16_23345 [Pseudanabaena sp. ELA645]
MFKLNKICLLVITFLTMLPAVKVDADPQPLGSISVQDLQNYCKKASKSYNAKMIRSSWVCIADSGRGYLTIPNAIQLGDVCRTTLRLKIPPIQLYVRPSSSGRWNCYRK